jgi:hypothetical protein
VPPIADVEWRIGQNVIRPQVEVLVAGKGIGWLTAKIKVDAANGPVHLAASRQVVGFASCP